MQKQKKAVGRKKDRFLRGPWRDIQDWDNAGRWREKIESRDCWPICVMSLTAGKQKYDLETIRANKRVIVKSPEMFDVLAALIKIDDESRKTVRKACETGEGCEAAIETWRAVERVIDKSRRIVKAIV